ncbi:hypothetical protein J2S53_002546 [Actinopolyspora lacussalsi]|nr:hypothetical protein [Actinopolyspora lacussalsi]
MGTEPLNTSSGHAWFSSVFESKWHACPTNTAVRNHGVRALCGHLSRRGPYRARASSGPPDEDGLSVCDACLHAIGYLPPRPPRLPPVWINHSDTEQGWPSTEQDWPTTAPDEPEASSGELPSSPHPAGAGHPGLPVVA